MTEISKEVIKAYALENAIKYKGEANQGAVLAGLFAEGLEKSKIKDIMPTIQKVIKEVNKLSPETQLEEYSKLNAATSKREIREGLKELPNAEKGKVVMRLAPFPSGPLHIGNARPFILNDEYVKMYDGKLLLVMDDTIGSAAKKIEPQAYKLIEEGTKWLDINYDKNIIYKSDRTEKYYAYAEELLKKGYMYVCDCDQETMHDLKQKGIACACREFPPERQMERWKEMFKAKMGSMTVRLKTNMQDPDPAFRDRVMFKISDLPHPRTKNKFRVYPSMEFSWGIDDHILGVTHVLRGIDHQMSTRVQDFIRKIFNWSNPESIYNGHFAIEGIKISKSKGAKEVNEGSFIGWNDPRTWSLQSLEDRGIQPKAIRDFILSMGIKKSNSTIPVESLYILNKKLLEDAPRYFFVEQPEKIKISGTPELTAKIPLHPSKKLGTREYKTSQEFLISKIDYDIMQNGNYRLMHLLNFKSDNVERMKPRTFSFLSSEPDNDIKTKFIQWLPANVDNINVEIIMPDGSTIKGKGEPKLKDLKLGTTIQFERFGFVKLHKKSKDKLEFWFTHN
ncbi:glutamate--tRNA ligase [archaeon]|jgi:glutamyl-tRNA synthetase|nr:glutamate--tRNA ligase [archaeon]